MSAVYPYKRRKRRFFKIKIAFLILFSIIIAFSVVILRNVSGVLLSVSEATAKSYTTIAVTQAVEETLAYTPQYSSLITISRDKDGNITDIIANTAVINAIARQTAYKTQAALNELTSQGIDIPVGAFTGIDALAGFGFKINFKVIPVSTVECHFISRFTSAGINQTLHLLYISVISDISIVTPSKTIKVGATDEVLVCESIIVGDIPDFILGSGWLNSNGALVPQTSG